MRTVDGRGLRGSGQGRIGPECYRTVAAAATFTVMAVSDIVRGIPGHTELA